MKPRILRSGALLTLLALLGCGATSESHTSKSSPTVVEAGSSGIVAAIAHEDARVDVPTFLWVSRDPSASAAAPFADAEVASIATMRALKATLRLSKDALASIGTPIVHDDGKGAIVAKFTQRVAGREVFRAGTSVVMRRSFEPVAVTGMVAPSLVGRDVPFALGAEEALRLAYRATTGTDLGSGKTASIGKGASDTETFESDLFSQPVRVKEVFFPKRDELEPAYRVELLLAGGMARSFVISAVDGQVLFQNNLVRFEDFQFRTWASPDTLLPMDGPQGNAFTPHPTGKPDGAKPTFVPTQLVKLQNFPFSKNDPWLPPGATETRGNNIDAYSDVVSPNGFTASSADLRANLSSPTTFDWTYDTDKSPNATPESVKGTVNHLFYVTNFLHDWFYDSGFDEKSGNAQVDNFARGGKGNDRILVEAQDYSGRNNANAATPADGASPRIQMYVFAGKTTASLTVATPASIAGTKTVGSAGAFGKDKFVTTGQVVLANDSSGTDEKDGCEVLTNAAEVKDKIVLVHRGNCSFVQKAQRVQTAGGIGVIVANVASSDTPNSAPYMGGQAGDVTIPALSLSLPDGQALEAGIAQGANVTMRREGTSDLDGGLDTGVVSHEWGHVLSNRLIGNADGLNTNQSGGLGEGWGDFTAQLVMVRADDLATPSNANWNGVYPTGTYATSGSGDDSYFGIRRQPYSTDMTKNGLTFKHISDGNALPKNVPTSFGEDGSNNSEVHATGEVWATMLWECYASLLRDPRYTFTQAQDRMKRYYIQALKATPVDPTLLEARDAVIAVAFASDEGDFQSFWKAFAKRGAGVGATGPGKSSPDNRGTNESFVVGNDVQIVSATLADDVLTCDKDGILDADEIGTIEVTIRNAGAGTLDKTTAKVSSKSPDVTFSESGEIKFPILKPFEVGKARVKIVARGSRPIEALDIDVAIADPSLAVPRSIETRIPVVRDADEVEASSAKDDVQTKGTSWVVTAKDRTGTSEKWKRVRVGSKQYWSVPNAGEPADHKLTSASFAVKGDSFGLKFKHRWAFESSEKRKLDFDGGVVEVSIDGGSSWKDISEYGPIDYNVTLDNDKQGTNPIKGRPAFGRTSEGYPDVWQEAVVKARIGAPAEAVQLRFRAGSDDNTGEAGWDVDDIELTDVASKPFWSFVAQQDACDEAGPKANAGPTKTVAPKVEVKLEGSATHPNNLPLKYGWTQLDGPPVVLAGQDSPTLIFTSPDTTTETKLTFALRANDGALLSPASRVDVLVKSSADPVPEVSGGCGCHTAGEPTENKLSSVAIGALVLGLVRRRRAMKES